MYSPRLNYIQKITKHKTQQCPECKNKLSYDETHAQTYCPNCGIVTQEPINYVGLEKITYPLE